MLNLVREETVRGSKSGVTQPSDHLDTAGAFTSFLCAIHCAVLPFVVTMLPLVGLGFLASEPVEWGLLAASATLGTLSLCLGFREHRSRKVFGFLGIGLAFLVAGHLIEHHEIGEWGALLMVAGGLTVAGTHLLNRALCRSCRSCHDHGCEVGA